MAVMAFHAGIALREAVTVIRVAGDVAEQLVHGFIKVFVALIGHLQLILAVRSPRDVEFFEVKALDVFYRALLPRTNLLLFSMRRVSRTVATFGASASALAVAGGFDRCCADFA